MSQSGAVAIAAHTSPARGTLCPDVACPNAAEAPAGGSVPLPADFYNRPVLDVARDLLGCVVDRDGVAGRIVETEAYHESEPACHAFVGVTPRTRILFGVPSTAYVYRSYGIHSLLNAVCEPEGVGAAVLIRALEPVRGVERMRTRRAGRSERELCSGPGKLTQALDVELDLNGASLVHGPVRILARPNALKEQVLCSERIGITKATELRWRFCLAGSPHVSRPRPL